MNDENRISEAPLLLIGLSLRGSYGTSSLAYFCLAIRARASPGYRWETLQRRKLRKELARATLQTHFTHYDVCGGGPFPDFQPNN